MKLPKVDEIKQYFVGIKQHIVTNLLIISEGLLAARTVNLYIAKDELANILDNHKLAKVNGKNTKTELQEPFQCSEMDYTDARLENSHTENSGLLGFQYFASLKLEVFALSTAKKTISDQPQIKNRTEVIRLISYINSN